MLLRIVHGHACTNLPINFVNQPWEPEEVAQALVWLICACQCGKTQECNYFFQQARASEVEVSNFKQPLLGSVKVREVF